VPRSGGCQRTATGVETAVSAVARALSAPGVALPLGAPDLVSYPMVGFAELPYSAAVTGELADRHGVRDRYKRCSKGAKCPGGGAPGRAIFAELPYSPDLPSYPIPPGQNRPPPWDSAREGPRRARAGPAAPDIASQHTQGPPKPILRDLTGSE
jgi:peptidoglycan/xylan/chitin deacetylase (PgdA/CDA1 family)